MLARKGPRDLALLKLMASMGLRIGDIVRLLRAQVIDSDREIVRVLRVKMERPALDRTLLLQSLTHGRNASTCLIMDPSYYSEPTPRAASRFERVSIIDSSLWKLPEGFLENARYFLQVLQDFTGYAALNAKIPNDQN